MLKQQAGIGQNVEELQLRMREVEREERSNTGLLRSTEAKMHTVIQTFISSTCDHPLLCL